MMLQPNTSNIVQRDVIMNIIDGTCISWPRGEKHKMTPNTECSFQLAIICRQIKWPVQQQLAFNNLCEFPISTRSHLVQPALQMMKHKAHHSHLSKMCVYKVTHYYYISAALWHSNTQKEVLQRNYHSCFST